MENNLTTIGVSGDMPLSAEMCQHIHAAALLGALRGLHPLDVPDHIDVELVKQRVALAGPDGCLAHPSDIERTFMGVTLGTYRTIGTLYCSRLGRSIGTVWRVVNAVANRVQSPAISYEAVWAICLYLEKRRRAAVDVSVERGADTWRVGPVVAEILMRTGDAPPYRPAFMFVTEAHGQDQRVLSFRVTAAEAPAGILQETASLALYDALVAQRRPQRAALAGVLWRLPRRVLAAEGELSRACHAVCKGLGVPVESAAAVSEQPIQRAVREIWARQFAGRVLQQSHCEVMLDGYLSKMHGYGPHRERGRLGKEYAGFTGYNEDPAELFPLLRTLLPERTSVITQEGAVEWRGKRYSDRLLLYWPGQAVTIRLSEEHIPEAWVYLSGEILCQAAVRKSVRQDMHRTRPGAGR